MTETCPECGAPAKPDPEKIGLDGYKPGYVYAGLPHSPSPAAIDWRDLCARWLDCFERNLSTAGELADETTKALAVERGEPRT